MRQWLYEKRRGFGLSQDDVASMCRIIRQYYRLIENGSRGCRVPVAKRIAAALGFDWQLFFEGSSDSLTDSGNGEQ